MGSSVPERVGTTVRVDGELRQWKYSGGKRGDRAGERHIFGAPSGRDWHTAVWTGTRMIVWGGNSPAPVNTGAQYDPVGNAWAATTTTGAPSGRAVHTAVWTGTKMIVWGGASPANENTGGRWNPLSYYIKN